MYHPVSGKVTHGYREDTHNSIVLLYLNGLNTRSSLNVRSIVNLKNVAWINQA